CEFCSVSTYNGGKFRFRPPAEVCAEIASLARPALLPKKLIMFADDNVMIHERYSRDLFSQMIPLGVHWIGQASLAGLHKVENIEHQLAEHKIAGGERLFRRDRPGR